MTTFFTTDDPQHPYGLDIDGNVQQFATEAKRDAYLQWWQRVANEAARRAQSASAMGLYQPYNEIANQEELK